MSGSFKDHFSSQADVYARYRPTYPDALFDYLATLTPGRDLAWDCGTGNGQAAIGLAKHFSRVIASDPSTSQIEHAISHPRVRYVVGPAESPPPEAMGADLVTVAQALHWFDFDRFYPALTRVLKPEGVFAAWGYGLMTIAPAVDSIVNEYYSDIVGPYWPPDRRLIEEQYRTIPFPLMEIVPKDFQLEADWSLDLLFGYLETWSATQRYIKDRAANPLDVIRRDLASAWGTVGLRHVTWPVFMRVGRRPYPA